MKISIGCDHGALALKNKVVSHLEGKGVEDKEMNLIVEILTDLANDLADLEDYTAELTEQVDAVDEDLNTLEEDFYEEWDDEDDCDCCDCDCCDCDDEYYDVTCPSCGEDFEVDEDTLLDGGVECPACGEHLEFDFDEDEEAEDEE